MFLILIVNKFNEFCLLWKFKIYIINFECKDLIYILIFYIFIWGIKIYDGMSFVINNWSCFKDKIERVWLFV